jgi:hypothetical protein
VLHGIDFHRFDALSKDFAQRLFAAFPEWRALARAEMSADSGAHYLVVEVDSPTAAIVDGPMRIDTDGEVIVEWAGCHTHYEWSPDPSYPVRGNPLVLIAGILNESYFVCSNWKEGRIAVLSFRRTTDVSDPESLRMIPSATRVTARSWNGNLNRDCEVPSRLMS